MNSSLRWRFCEKESMGVEHFGGREVIEQWNECSWYFSGIR